MGKLILRPLKGTEAPIFVDGLKNPTHYYTHKRNHLIAIKYIREILGVGLQKTVDQVHELLEKGVPIEFEFEEERLGNLNTEEWFNWFLTQKREFFTEYLALSDIKNNPREFIICDCESELLAHAYKNINSIFKLSPRKFEELVAAIFRNHGYEVLLTPQTRDGGYDILAVQHSKLTGREVTLVECKRYHPAKKSG